MAHRSWNESYDTGELPWDTGVPEPLLVEFVSSGRVQPARAMEIGAGTGTNSIWLAESGFEVLGIDIAPRAVERANAKLNGRGLGCRFATMDFLATPGDDPSGFALGGRFQFIFDRGCFHVFDEVEERAHFATQVARALAPGGLWLSLIGSTEGPPREVGPPRRSAREVMLAVEPALEIVELRSVEFRAHEVKAWLCLARSRGSGEWLVTSENSSPVPVLKKTESPIGRLEDASMNWRQL